MVQFDLLPCPPPPHLANSRGFAIFFSPGGLFPTPGHAKGDISPPRALDRTHVRFGVHFLRATEQ